MLLSAVSVLVVAQSSSEIPEGLMNNPVCLLGNMHCFEWIIVNLNKALEVRGLLPNRGTSVSPTCMKGKGGKQYTLCMLCGRSSVTYASSTVSTLSVFAGAVFLKREEKCGFI